MQHFIIFERQFGHCTTHSLRAASLQDALTKFAVKESGAEVKSDGSLVSSDGVVYSHPLAFIESQYKSHDKFDELQWDEKNDKLLNGASWHYLNFFCGIGSYPCRNLMSDNFVLANPLP